MSESKSERPRAAPELRAPRGMRDVLPAEVALWELLESTARRSARLAGYREIRTPLIEEQELFARSVGDASDIVEKEMFTLQPGRRGEPARASPPARGAPPERGSLDDERGALALRPEGTAGVVRAYLQAGWAKTDPQQKLFYVGPMFRYERPQKGRERMFTQFGAECIGSLDPRLDAETIELVASFFEALGLAGLAVRVNSMGDGEDRERYREALREFLRPTLAAHCELCRSRFEKNVLRVLDCKNPQCQALHRGVPRLIDFLSAGNRAHFEAVGAALAKLGRQVEVDPGIVRGLDYYTRTVFELHYAPLGARSALCGGGRYDHLVRDLGGPDLPAVGFAVGFTGTLLVLGELGLAAGVRTPAPEVYVVSTEEALGHEALALAVELRHAGLGAVFAPDRKSVGAQLKAASKGGHRLAAIVGPQELERGEVQLKDLARGEQRAVPRAELAAAARAALADPGGG
jgi:histidyl-tRNA synthetase